jgi:hypothetical protein
LGAAPQFKSSEKCSAWNIINEDRCSRVQRILESAEANHALTFGNGSAGLFLSNPSAKIFNRLPNHSKTLKLHGIDRARREEQERSEGINASASYRDVNKLTLRPVYSLTSVQAGRLMISTVAIRGH